MPGYCVSAGHPDAARIAASILERGGNAVDAGVAACLALSVLHAEQVQIGGISPIIVKMANDPSAQVVDGVGRWPAATRADVFRERHRGRIPVGIARTVVPGAVGAWITALRRFGTMRFAHLADPAARLAAEGFPAHRELVETVASHARSYLKYPGNARIWMPGGRIPDVGDQITYPELSRTIERMIAADRAAPDRESGLDAVYDLFYRGEIAREMVSHVADEGGWLDLEDLATHTTRVEAATQARISGGTVFTCGPWSQGPALSQALMIIERSLRGIPLEREGIFYHHVLEALKLALADRDALYGDPDFADIPMARLLCAQYAADRAGLIDGDKAHPALPHPGLPGAAKRDGAIGSDQMALDTSVAVVADSGGNVFAATPSDAASDGPVVPGLGFVISTRGSQSFVEPTHRAAAAPGRRPRVTACPTLFVHDDGRVVAGGGPGGDYQLQAMTQVLARHLFRGESLAAAVAAPRVFTQSAPQSSSPHLVFPGRISVEDEVPEGVFDDLVRRGHKAVRTPAAGVGKASLCLVSVGAGGDEAPADPRRASGQILQAGGGDVIG
ncbi:gamma-glutamyltransferase family protein [Palleronia sp. KMU-117]|uniref:gamma-glutamyltransferase family protein n=1 Tax=Palleronia sp. KMU-117 TaxID=3434108 RepID=UPI003D7387E1